MEGKTALFLLFFVGAAPGSRTFFYLFSILRIKIPVNQFHEGDQSDLG